MDDVAPVVFPPLGHVWAPEGADVPALVDLRAFRTIDFADVSAWQWQGLQHLGANTREVLFVFDAVECMGAIGAVLAEAGNEVRLLCRLVLWRIPVIDAPENAHPAQVALEIDILDFFADDLFRVERALLA